MTPNRYTRRASLARLGGLAAATIGGKVLLGADDAGAGNKAGEDGIATFTTIYPGWYSGRTVHIHVKVHVGGTVVHTGQLFFPDSLTDVVYQASPYSSRPNRDLRNAQDSIYVNGGKRGMLTVKKSGSAYVGSIAMGLHRCGGCLSP